MKTVRFNRAVFFSIYHTPADEAKIMLSLNVPPDSNSFTNPALQRDTYHILLTLPVYQKQKIRFLRTG